MKKLPLLLLLLAALPWPAARAQRRPIGTITQLTDSLQRLMQREHMPGLLLTLVAHDSVLFEGGLGLADVAQRTPVTAHTRFRLGSITKSFVVLGLLQQVQLGRLNLQAEVRKIAPEVPIDNPWEATDPVRVIHLLEHTAGFDDMHLTHAYNLTATDPRGLAGVALFTPELRCRWRPGERMSYSNPGYQLAGYLLEKTSGQPYETYLAQHLLTPLGLPDATFALRPAGLPRLAQGYRYDDGQYQPIPARPIYAGAAGSLSASAADMTRWLQLFLHDLHLPDGTALLPPGTLATIETTHTPLSTRAGLPAGYGLANYPMNWQGKAVFRGHSGGIDGFTSAFGYCRALGLGYAFSNNGGGSYKDLEKLIQEFLLRHAPTPPAPPTIPLDAAALTPYLGHYAAAAPRQAMAGLGDYLLGDRQLVRRGPLLLLQPLIGPADTLLPTGTLTFRRPRQLLPSLALTHDHDGRRALVGYNAYYLEASNLGWWLRPALLALTVLLIGSSSLAGLIWLILALRRQVPRGQVLPRLLPLLASLTLIVTVAGFLHLTDHVWLTGSLRPLTVLASLGPLVFAACVLAGLLLTLRRARSFRSRLALGFLLLTYAALGWLALVLASYGWFSLRLWTV